MMNTGGGPDVRVDPHEVSADGPGAEMGMVKAGCCVHQLIEQRASDTPDAVALVCRNEQLTYAELNGRGNQVASYLIKLGAGPEKLVSVCLERSLEMVVCLLGILKSGAAYVPLDPGYPAERLAWMLKDARAEVLLYRGSLVPTLSGIGTRAVALDTCWPLMRAEPMGNMDCGVTPSHLAYVIYTSGSTGKPKGVMIEHGNVASFFEAMNARVPHSAGRVWLAVTSPSFDISVLELFWTLSRGFKVALYAGDETSSRPSAEDYSIAALIERHGVTHLQCTPSMASMLLLDKRTREALGQLSVLLVGGEMFPVTLAEQLREVVKGTILNMYGPTETTVWSTVYEVGSGALGSRIAVGTPIAKTQTYIADDDLRPVPAGVVGELLIGGPGVGRGYLRREEITAERFIANPFPADGAARLYRTGDLARYLPDGNIELLGRMDQQVKIRGHRVELGEIEFVLNEHSAVRESVVLMREAAGGDKVLVAYIIPRDGQTTERQELRRHVQKKLPGYMVPSHFMFMTAFPQTPNRKIDRNAFPPPDEEPACSLNDAEQPATDTEEKLAAIWKELLGIERLGRHENFFRAGGHSMLAMQLVSRVRKRLNADLVLKNVFEQQTLAGMAELIEALLWQKSAQRERDRAGEREVVDV
jgi:amino acid adenylation domain-containing protein